MTIKQIANSIEEIAPLHFAEDFDNVGLLIGDYNKSIDKVLVSLDCLEDTVDEAIAEKAELIVCFHPIIFSGLKKLNGNSYVERVVLKAIKNDIAIYAIHTALDNSKDGVSKAICDRLGLVHSKILIPKKSSLVRLTYRVPTEDAKRVSLALFELGAGKIGKYDQCSTSHYVKGSFRPMQGANPVIGSIGEQEEVDEQELSLLIEEHKINDILKGLFDEHPYEEVAYELTRLDNMNQDRGMGMFGEFENPIPEQEFIELLKTNMNTKLVRHSSFSGKLIKKVAVLGGSGAFAISQAKKIGADAYVSADFKYHDFFKAENSILLCDIGHYESEQYTKELIVDYLKKKFPNFAVVLSNKNTNPIHYS